MFIMHISFTPPSLHQFTDAIGHRHSTYDRNINEINTWPMSTHLRQFRDQPKLLSGGQLPHMILMI